MFQKALMGLWTTCVLLAPHIASAATGDIVLYATDGANLHGNWTRVADQTAAGGQRLASSDQGWSNTDGPLASPAHYIDFTFDAPAATPYHVWVRLRAAANSTDNDSVLVQFSDAVSSSGDVLFKIGTASGLHVTLARNAAGKGLSGWGWQDRAHSLSQQTTIVFATSGRHTLRIQTGEDGVSFDQIVLSPIAYLTIRPGLTANDAMIMPRPTNLAKSTSLRAARLPKPASAPTASVSQQTEPPSAPPLPAAVAVAPLSAPALPAPVAARASSAPASPVPVTVAPPSAPVLSAPIVVVPSPAPVLSAPVAVPLPSAPVLPAPVAVPPPAAPGLPPVATEAVIGPSPSGDIVMHSADASNLGGNWTLVADQTAAGGQRLASSDQGWSNTGGPLVSPPHYIDFTFNAPSATSYRVWVRMRAGANSRDNDSVFTQFSDVVGLSGASFYGIGTTDGFIVNLANDATGNSLSGWGWQGGAYWLGQATTVAFATGGSHTLRIQTREDGVSIDQVVLSQATFMASAPGPLANDATIVPKTGGVSLPGPWSAGDVGLVGLPGAASFAGGVFAVGGAGADIWGTADAFHFVSRGVSGDAQIVARVVSLENGNTFAKAGVMFRDTTAAGSAHVLLDVRPNGSVEFMSRSATGAATAYLGGTTRPIPGWLKLIRSGNTFTGAVSADGVAWTVVGSTSVALAVNVPAGLVVTSHSTAQLGHAIFDHVDVTVTASTPPQPPSAPGLSQPVNMSSGIGVNTPLTWSAAGATSYDVNFGSGNPPARVASGGAMAAYTPAAMLNGVQYFWQVVAHNAVGTTMGPVWSFTTVTAVPTPGAGAPTAYNAMSDRNPYAKPALPQLGPAGFTFADPTFGSAMLRITDGQTRPGMLNRSFRVPSNAHLNAWNADSTAFLVISNDGTTIPYAFNAATMTASRMQPNGSENGGLTLGFYVEPQFSLVNPNLIYGAVSGGNNRTISQYDFQTGVYSPLLNLDSIVGGLAGTYVGGVMTGGTPGENLLTFFGGTSQDHHFYALWAPIGNLGARKLLNTLASTINGVPTDTALNFHLHAMQVDRSGRFVFLYPTGPELGSPRFASQVYVWDTAADTVTAITSGGADGGAAMHPAGHDAAGHGVWINQDCCTSSTWDAAQWQFRDLTAVAQTSDLISPVPAVKQVYLADHTSWNNAQPTTLVPVISSTYRYGNNPAPWRAWDDEIIGIETANGGGGNVWRFAHHRSNVAADNNPAGLYFWYQPIANVSPNGQWVLFTSNWEKTLGSDAAEGTFRQDVFLVRLTPAP